MHIIRFFLVSSHSFWFIHCLLSMSCLMSSLFAQYVLFLLMTTNSSHYQKLYSKGRQIHIVNSLQSQLMPVWGLPQPFKAFVKGTVGSIMISSAKPRAAKPCIPAKTPLTKVEQL